jgi:23S rRNA (adenine2030-N6)-methyltransferase
MVWHPLQGRSQTEQFYRQMRDSGITRILKAELSILPEDVDKRLNGSGVLLINPPWPMEESLREILPWLHNVLSPDGRGGWQVDWLVSE